MQSRRTLQLFLAFGLAITSLPAKAQVVTATVPVGAVPFSMAVNYVTNKIYVANMGCNSFPCSAPGTVTVIDGATDSTTTVTVGVNPYAIAVNTATNKIYVTNYCGNDTRKCGLYPGTVTVIDGITNNTATVTVGFSPNAVAVNPVTNEIYVVNFCGNNSNCNAIGTVTVINGATDQTGSVDVGFYPAAAAVNRATNHIYVTNTCGNDPTCTSPGTVTVIDGVTNNTTSVNAGILADPVTVNSLTNKIYVANRACFGFPCRPGTVTVIDGATNNTLDVNVGFSPNALAIDPITNKIYVTNECGNDSNCSSSSAGTMTVIDGATNNTLTVNLGFLPYSRGCRLRNE